MDMTDQGNLVNGSKLGLDSDTSAHDALISATMDAENLYGCDDADDNMIILQACHAPPSSEGNALLDVADRIDIKKQTGCRNRKKAFYKHNLVIKEIQLDHNDLCRRVASLQKRVLIGRWMFPDGENIDMDEWVR